MPSIWRKFEHFIPAHAEIDIHSVLKAALAKVSVKGLIPEFEKVLNFALINTNAFPKINLGSNETLDNYLEKWVKMFENGFNSRPSVRASTDLQTVHDDILNHIISCVVEDITQDKITYYVQGHRLLMKAENILGLLLEEYIYTRLKAHGWVCCWGNSLVSIDFITHRNMALQVKNSDNSENSSSDKVRAGTTILKWHRRISSTGEMNWDALNEIAEQGVLSEDDFRAFISEVAANNTSLLIVDSDLS
ncbi:MAG: SinI family restriction endonuclease [Bacteroidia bacterium]|nr:SinI family restriction endonuclease [Bacteroidia bacterium]